MRTAVDTNDINRTKFSLNFFLLCQLLIILSGFTRLDAKDNPVFANLNNSTYWELALQNNSYNISWQSDSLLMQYKAKSLNNLFDSIRSNSTHVRLQTRWGVLIEKFGLISINGSCLYDVSIDAKNAFTESSDSRELSFTSQYKILSKNGRVLSCKRQSEMNSPDFGYPHQSVRFETFDLNIVKTISLKDITDTTSIIEAIKDVDKNGLNMYKNNQNWNVFQDSIKIVRNMKTLNQLLHHYCMHIPLDQLLQQFTISAFNPVTKHATVNLIYIESVPVDIQFITLDVLLKEPYRSDFMNPEQSDMFFKEDNLNSQSITIIPPQMVSNYTVNRSDINNYIDTVLKNASAYFKSGKKYDAVKELEEYITKNRLVCSSDNVTVFNDLAFYYEQTGQYQDGLNILLDIVNKFPNRTVAFINLGDTYFGLNNFEKSKAAYLKYIDIMKKDGKDKKIPVRVFDRVK